MSALPDTITRWECPKCGRDWPSKPMCHSDGWLCPGVPVERTYVAVDALKGQPALDAGEAAVKAWTSYALSHPSGKGLWVAPMHVARSSIEAAIAAVTGDVARSSIEAAIAAVTEDAA